MFSNLLTVIRASNQSHPFAAYLPQANMGPNERQLLKAASKGDIGETLKLIQAGANIDAINEEGHSAVTMAISKQHMNVVRLLIESGGTMDRTGFLVHKPLHVAVLTGNVDLVRYVLDNGADIDETTARGSVLLLAVGFQQESIVTLLLSRNANPDIGVSGIVPLYRAIVSRKESFIYLLMKYGARACNVPAVYMRKLSPACQNLVRHWASHARYSVYAKTIRRESSDRNQQEAALSSALSYAVDNGHKEVHSIFIELATEFAIPVDERYRNDPA
jgi:ankyrin repeat protein